MDTLTEIEGRSCATALLVTDARRTHSDLSSFATGEEGPVTVFFSTPGSDMMRNRAPYEELVDPNRML